MLQAYFDASGEHTSTPFLCMAGYVADHDDWSNFNAAWFELLRKYQIEALHMREFQHGSGQYAAKNWTPAQRDDILTEFLLAIRTHVLLGVGIGVDASYYRSLPKAAQKKADPQIFIFERTLRKLRDKLIEAGHDAGIALIIDDDARYAMACYQSYKRIKKNDPHTELRFGSICFGDHRYIYPLQGADVLAYLTNRYGRGIETSAPLADAFAQLLQSTTPGYGIEYVSELWDAEELKRVFGDSAPP
jgi:hypothetical protein